jgi:hypothetical protein
MSTPDSLKCLCMRGGSTLAACAKTACMALIGLCGCNTTREEHQLLNALPSSEQVECVSVVAYYWHDADDPAKIALSTESLAWLRRMRDGTATVSDAYRSAPAVQASGIVLEITDGGLIADIVRLIQEGLRKSVPSEWGNAFYAGLATIQLEWEQGSHGRAYIVRWWTEDEFLVNWGRPDEKLFASRELAVLLRQLARQQSIRVWWGSNPELDKPIVWPE